jgi:alcohol dehydrogenase, propanol-preferring
MASNVPTYPKTQIAQVLEKAGAQLEYKEIPVRAPGPDEVLVNIKVSGFSHSQS